jgi:hypothetical protein
MLTTPLMGLLILACSGDPVRSTCDAACDLAVSCHEAERDIDAEAKRAECLAAAEASDDSCAKAADGKLDPATKKVVEECVAALDQQAAEGECDTFTRVYDVDGGEVPEPAVPPTACAPHLETIEAARDATAETGEELCQRFTDTFCARTEECVIGDFGGDIPQEIIDELGTPFELCVDKLSAQTQSCIDNDLYAAEESLTDVNTGRQGARSCLAGFASITCDQITGGDMPAECGASFTSTEDSLAFATALFEVAQDFQEAAE